MADAKCRHFRGIQYATCLTGVSLETLTRPLPCLQLTEKAPPDTCPKREWMTDEDHAAREREVAAFAERVGRLWSQGLCYICEKPIEPSRTVGSCMYGACGHRIGAVSRARAGKGRK